MFQSGLSVDADQLNGNMLVQEVSSTSSSSRETLETK